jgi:hypothetical protein
VSALCLTAINLYLYIWIFIALVHRNNSPRKDMSLHADIISWDEHACNNTTDAVLLHPLWDSLQYTRDLLSIGMKDYLPESKRASATFYNAPLHYE